MDPEIFAENVRDAVEERSLALIPLASTDNAGRQVDAEHLNRVLDYAEKHDLPVLVHEKLNREKSENQTIEPTRRVKLFVEGPYSTFRIVVSSR